MLTLYHPTLDALSDFLADDDARSRTVVAAHLEGCQRCRESLRFLRSVTAAAASVPVAVPSDALFDRVLTSRAAGVRTILPTGETRPRRTHRWPLSIAAAAGVGALAASLLIRRVPEAQAGATGGAVTFTPATPRAGQRVEVRYAPDARLGREPWVALRARLRSSSDESYNSGFPIVRLAVLRRDDAGGFRGAFALPDSVVFAALVVEDSAATIIDDQGGREWELLVSDSSGNPRFEALEQRANDMMGRNWEEGFATARRMVALYPGDVRGWIQLRAFQGWLGLADADSVRRLHNGRLAEFDARFSRTAPSTAELGAMAWYASYVDSTVARRWRARLLHEAPTDNYALQWRLIDLLGELSRQHDTITALRSLDALWKDADGNASVPRRRRAQISSIALAVALATADTGEGARWTARFLADDRYPRQAARLLAQDFAGRARLRADGMRRIRAELAAFETLPPSERQLAETADKRRARHAAARRALLAALGRALVAAGAQQAGLDTLAIAAATAWDVDVFRAARVASLAAGDTSGALTMGARLAVDPRTTVALADSVRATVSSRVGDAGWRDRLAAARAEFVERMLVESKTRSLPKTVRLRDATGRTRDLRELTKGHVTAVVFWSRFCGPALEQLPRMNVVAEQLGRSGVRVVSIVEEGSPSRELARFLREKRVAVPTYLDAWREASRAFEQWGTPYYYVLDADGRIRFDVTTSADELLARAEALRLASAPNATP
jgi:thiol-disulfide isomerase/thioredoxin